MSDRNLGSIAARFAKVLVEEFGQVRPLQHALGVASSLIPAQAGNGFRARLMRLRGIPVGEGTIFYDTPKLSGGEARHFGKLSIGKNCVVDIGCSFEVGDAITIGDSVTIGYEVIVITTSHELGPREHRAGKLTRGPVIIEDGAWIGPRSVILPGVTIGAGSIVDPGSIVNKTVAPNTRVRGAPAKVIETLPT